MGSGEISILFPCVIFTLLRARTRIGNIVGHRPKLTVCTVVKLPDDAAAITTPVNCRLFRTHAECVREHCACYDDVAGFRGLGYRAPDIAATGTATITATGTATIAATGTAAITATGTATIAATGTAAIAAAIEATGTAAVAATGTATVAAAIEATGTAAIADTAAGATAITAATAAAAGRCH
jgi:hypothetical protein